LSETFRETKGGGAALRAWIWILGSAAVLVAGLHCSRLPTLASAFRVPATPLDLTSGQASRLWAFLMEARDAVPPGASYTVEAQDRDDEMTLYMFSLGILFEQEALPSSYFGVATPDSGDRARFILVYGAARPRLDQARLVRTVGSGAIYDRRAA
jgi:hypothetical protein